MGGAAAAIAAHGLKGFSVASPTAVFSFTFDPELPQHESMESSIHLLAEIVCRDTQQTLETVLAWFSKRVEFTAEAARANGLVDLIASEAAVPPRQKV